MLGYVFFLLLLKLLKSYEMKMLFFCFFKSSINCSFFSQAKRKNWTESGTRTGTHKTRTQTHSVMSCCCCWWWSRCSCSCCCWCWWFYVDVCCCGCCDFDHDATKCNTQNKTENKMRNILKNLTRIFSSSSCVLCSWCSSSLMDTLLSGWRCASSIAWKTMRVRDGREFWRRFELINYNDMKVKTFQKL